MIQRSSSSRAFEEVRDRTKAALGVIEEVPNSWNNACVCLLSLQREKHPEADEQTLLALTEIAIYDYYLEGPGAKKEAQSGQP